MKSIGFVDYYISEWHANNYPQWIKEMSEKCGTEFYVKCAWAEEYVSPVDGRNTDEWCKEFGAEKCDTIAELCEKCDYILVLSPSNPEKHLGYAKEVLKCKKNTYIDKTFADNYANAKAIFDIAEEHGTKFFSSSALRYSTELDEIGGCKNIITCGGGNIAEYIIHQIEMVVKSINDTATAVKVENQSSQYVCSVRFENEKSAVMVHSPSMPFTVSADKANGESTYKEIQSDFFKNLIADILHFYQTGETSFDTHQTLEVIKIRDGVINAINTPGEWINL